MRLEAKFLHTGSFYSQLLKLAKIWSISYYIVLFILFEETLVFLENLKKIIVTKIEPSKCIR